MIVKIATGEIEDMTADEPPPWRSGRGRAQAR
jgi:hypothetical protein